LKFDAKFLKFPYNYFCIPECNNVHREQQLEILKTYWFNALYFYFQVADSKRDVINNFSLKARKFIGKLIK